MVSLRGVYASRVNLLSCNQIHPSLPQSLWSANLPWPTSAPAAKPATSTEDDTDYDVLDIWRPLYPAPPAPTAQTFRSPVVEPGDSAMLNVWMCPEIDSRQRFERAKWRKAELVAERMTALMQASNKDRENKEVRRGTKRKVVEEQVESAVPVAPSSPDLLKPQSLLIPELLPKGMVPSQPAVVPQVEEPRSLPALDLGAGSHGMETGDMSLGLDLGFDIAQNSVKRGPVSGMSSSIMEIANFLERDIDVFTPLSAARTPRSTVVPSTPVSLPTNGLREEIPASKQRELIEDILKLSF